jgi:hypothetical protein
MAEVSGLDMVREIIGQINNLRRLVTINGKKFKWDGKKYVRAVDGKTFTKKELTSFVKNQKFTAPKTPKATKGELKVDGKTVYKRNDKLRAIKDKVQGVKSKALKIKNKGNQALQNAKLRIMQPEGAGIIDRRQRSINKRIGKGGVVLPIIDAVIDKTRLPDRGANFLTNMMFGQNMNLAQRDAFNAKRMDKWNNRNNKPNPEDVREDQLANFLKTQKTNPIENSINERDIREDQLANFLKTQKTNPVKEGPTKTETPKSEVKKPKNQKKDDNKPKEELKSTKVVKKKESKKNDPLKIHGKNPSAIQKKLLKAGFTKKQLEDLVTNYNKKYRNKRGW